MAEPTVNLPTYTDGVNLHWFIEPLHGPTGPDNFMERFPAEIYNRTIDSHITRFMYTLLGPSGAGWLRKNLLDARLAIEDHGIDLFDLERFYSDPFRFGRIVDEIYEEDPTGLLPRDEWDLIKTKDESFRSRAITFFNAARLGTSPEGMRLAAKSGLNHNAEIIEQFRYLFDVHSDDPLGLRNWGKTVSPQEFIVIPRQEISQTEIQVISFAQPMNTGSFVLVYNGRTTVPLAFNCSHFDVESALRAISVIGPNGVSVSGGPPPNDLFITFTGPLANQDVPELVAISSLFDVGPPITNRQIFVTTAQGGLEVTEETVEIPPTQQHNLQTALDFLRPTGSIPSFQSGTGRRHRQAWTGALATSEYTEVLRYVTGSNAVEWPSLSSIYWIEQGTEREAPRIKGDRRHHYTGFHNIGSITAYTDEALSDPNYTTVPSVLKQYNSEHVGNFGDVTRVIPFFFQFNVEPFVDVRKHKKNPDFNPPPVSSPPVVYTADRALADYAEPLTVSSIDGDTGTQFINGIYPEDYTDLSGVSTIKYKSEQFWASRAREAGAEILEIDLGSVQAVNFLTFETIRKPVKIEIAFDGLGLPPRRRFLPVNPVIGLPFPDDIFYDVDEQNPWVHLSYNFDDGNAAPIFTRYLRITLTRRQEDVLVEPRFLYNYIKKEQRPWGVEVKNLRVGRNVVV